MDLVLLSGGIESATLLHDRLRHGSLLALFVDYGQRAARRERETARRLCAIADVPFQEVTIPGLRMTFTRRDAWVAHVPPPARNVLAVSLAANVALHAGANTVYLGIQRDDLGQRDSTPPVLAALHQVLQGLGLALETPYAALSKAGVIRHGQTLGVDYTRTYSCLLGRVRPCGRCPQCLARAQAFREARART